MEPVTDSTLEPKADFAESKATVAEKKPPASTLFLLALAALALYFCYLIARPFLNPIFLAVMIAIVFHPVHVWLATTHSPQELGSIDIYNPGPGGRCCSDHCTWHARY